MEFFLFTCLPLNKAGGRSHLLNETRQLPCAILQHALATQQLHLLFLGYNFPFVPEPPISQFHSGSCASSLQLHTSSDSPYSWEEALLGMFRSCILQSWILLSSLNFLAITGSCDSCLLHKHEVFFAIHVMCLTLAKTSSYKVRSPII